MDRTGNQKLPGTQLSIPVAAATAIQEATMVAIGTDGYAVPASKAADMTIAGCAMRYADNSSGAAGDVEVSVRRGAFVWGNDGSIQKTDILKDAYVSDEKTVTITADGSSKAGTILAVDADGVTVDMRNSVEAVAE